MIIPISSIEPETLARIVEEFVTREGTDYGELEWELSQKVEQLMLKLHRGEVIVVFEEQSESVNLHDAQTYAAQAPL